MATIAEIMTAIATQIETALAEVTDIKIHVEGRTFNAAELPAVDMLLTGTAGFDEGLAGFGEEYGGIPLTIRVRVSPADLYAGEDLLLALMDDEDPLSIISALDADPTFGGVCSTFGYGNGWPWSGYEPFPDPNGGGDFLGSRLPIIVVKAQGLEPPVPPDPEPLVEAHYIYDGTKTGANPGVGRVAVKTWGGSDTWAVHKTDADGLPRTAPTVGETFVVTLENDDQSTLTVESAATDQGTWFQLQGTQVATGGPPAPGGLLTITKEP